MICEQAKLEDLEEILNLQKLAYKSEAEIYNDYSIQPLTETLEEIRLEYKEKIFLKTINDENIIIGSVRAFLKNGICFIGKLIVHPNMQNQGIGSSLMKEIEKRFSHANRYELFTGNKSERNLYLYKKLGYKEYKKEKQNDNFSLVYMEKINKTT